MDPVALSWISRLWEDNANWTHIEAALIGLFFLVANLALCFANHYMQREAIIEYGYPKARKRIVKKITRAYRIIDKLLLIKLCKEAKKKGPFMWLCVFFNILSCIAAVAEIIGYFACVITGGIGWSLVMLMLPGFAIFSIAGVVEFIPSYLALPSEKNRYKL